MLRDYQEQAVLALYRHLQTKNDNPCLVIPTGGGKTHVIAKICEDVAGWGDRALILAHRKELLEQSAEKIERYAPGVEVGIYSAGLNRRERQAQVVVAGIQSVYNRLEHFEKFAIVLIDEAHRIPPDGEGMYRTALRKLKEKNPHVRAIGLTATPYRMSTGWLCGPENILNEVCYEVSVKTLIDAGHLCKLVSKSGVADSLADLGDVGTRGGEFIPVQMETAFTEDAAKVRSAVRELRKYADNRNKVLIFSCGVIHAGMISAELQAQGETSVAVVTGDSPEILRAQVISDFRSGSLKYLININVLTEGFDAPNIDLIALLRATQSPGLYYQMVGRGLRNNPGKENCLVLDFGGNVERHGTVDRIIPTESVGSGQAPMKVCPGCQELVPMGSRDCPACGYAFPAPKEKEHARHEETASDTNPISEIITEWYDVERVSYTTHAKKGADATHPKTLRVTYYVDLTTRIDEWVCVEHERGSYARQKAQAWWAMRSRAIFPNSVEDAVEIAYKGYLRRPTKIKVKQEVGGVGKSFPRILEVVFESEIPEPPEPVGTLERQPGEDAEEEVSSGERTSFLEMMGVSEDEIPF